MSSLTPSRALHRSITLLNGLACHARRFLRPAAFALGALALAACEPAATTPGEGRGTGPSVDPGQPVSVALLVPGGTGDVNLEWLARSLGNAARMAASDAQGANIDLRILSTGSDPATAATSAQEAVADGARIIIGPLHADAANAAGNAVRGQGVNVLTFSNNPEIAGGNVFLLGNTFDNTAGRLVRHAISQGKRRFVLVAEDDLAGQIGARAIRAAVARNRGATLVGDLKHPVSTAGVDAVVPGIAAAATNGETDVIFMTANNDAVLPYLSYKLQEAGVNPGNAQLVGLTRWDQPAERLKLPGLQEGWFAVPDMPRLKAFEARYRAAFGEAPHPLAGLAYDGVSAVAAGLRAGRRDAVATSGLTQSAGFQGVTGIFRLNPDGTNRRALGVATIRGGELIVLDPAPQRAGGAGL